MSLRLRPSGHSKLEIEQSKSSAEISQFACDSKKDQTLRDIVLDVSVHPSQSCTTTNIVFSDSKDSINMSSIYKFVSKRTGVPQFFSENV